MEKLQAIWLVVSQIPRGRVCTYGNVAKLAGLPGYARYVGYALQQLTANSTIPWHRVINARGMISFPVGSERYQTQRALLINEGVYFNGQQIKLKHYLWRP